MPTKSAFVARRTSKRHSLFDFKVIAGLTAFVITLSGGAVAFGQVFDVQDSRTQAAGARTALVGITNRTIECFHRSHCGLVSVPATAGCPAGYAPEPTALCRETKPCCMPGGQTVYKPKYICIREGNGLGICNTTAQFPAPTGTYTGPIAGKPAVGITTTAQALPTTTQTAPAAIAANTSAVATDPSTLPANCIVRLVDPNTPYPFTEFASQRQPAGTSVRFKCVVTSAGSGVNMYDMNVYVQEAGKEKKVPILNNTYDVSWPVTLDQGVHFDCTPKNTTTNTIGKTCEYYFK